MENIEKLVRGRRSVRAYDGREVSEADIEKLLAFVNETENPFGIPVKFKLLDGKKQALSCPVVIGTDLYIGGKVQRVPYAEEAFGYSFELLVLYAQSLGIGTVWVGGTMDRAAFEKAMELGENEMMPCMSPLGYPAKKLSVRETLMRKAIKANSRIPFDELFFDSSFDKPLTEEKTGELAFPLEMVRWSPSAVNKQPWRAVVDDNAVHFYLKHAKNMGKIQNVDLGIALCHFALAAKEIGLSVSFEINDPGIATGEGTEYIASYQLNK